MMQMTVECRHFAFCVRLSPMYVASVDKILPAAVNVRLGRWVWSVAKGLRKLGVA